MSKKFNFQKIHISIGTISASAACLFFWQPKSMSLPPANPTVTEETSKSSNPTASRSKVKAYFDLSILPDEPAPIIVQQIIAPDVNIQRYQLLGITLNSRDAIALVSDGSNSLNLKLGDSFEGFIVSAIEARKIEFTSNDVVSTLELPH